MKDLGSRMKSKIENAYVRQYCGLFEDTHTHTHTHTVVWTVDWKDICDAREWVLTETGAGLDWGLGT